jgi:hypothetical protein
MLVEIATFRLVPGASEADFLAADTRVQTEFAPFQPGFVRRTTARGEDGGWLVLTLWASRATADGAQQAADADPAGSAFAALIQPDSRRVERYETLD